MKPAFATPTLALGSSQFVRCSRITSSSRPAFATARNGAARMMAEAPLESGSSLPTDGENVVDPPISSSAPESSGNSSSAKIGEDSRDDASSTSLGDSSGEESFFITKPGLMGLIDEDDDVDMGEIIIEPPGSWKNKQVIQEAQQKFKVHETDCGSPEFQIATLTKKIEYLTIHLKANPKDFSSTRGLLRMVATRRLNIRISQKLRNL
ncbi:Ribosomal protein S15 [Gracilaria domingensis]|nr:Ribosomal protein S15 [Gracilaria domingensis]